MKSLLAISLATIYGLLLRFVFGFLDGLVGIMSIAFLIIAPFLLGFLTIWLTPKRTTTSTGGAFFKPWLTCLAVLAITIYFSIEGSICWFMIYPLFSIVAGIGGVVAYKMKEKKGYQSDIDDIGKPNQLSIPLLMLLPLVIGFAEGDRSLSRKDFNISKTVVIPVSAANVWTELTKKNILASNTNNASFSNMLGFPKHLQTTLDTLATGGKRMALYDKGLYFEETITSYEPGKKLVLNIKTDPKKIPPTVMDEHILIGGKHVDILQDVYSIEKISDSSCSVTLSSSFYINTPFNWYAGIWAEYLMQDILQGEIDLISDRASKK